MAVAPDADAYAGTRVGMYFPGVTPYYDGQCVSLVKWFLGEMAGVANWNAARGNAKDMGRTLVSQGLAREVAWSERRRGDIVAYEYGTYGHIAVYLSGGRVFEENVNMPGTSRKYVVDDWVYTSRIGSENEAWRAGKNPHIYRLNGYSEAVAGGSDIPMVNDADNEYARWNKLFVQIRGRNAGRDEFRAAAVGRNWLTAMEILSDNPEADQATNWQSVGQTAVNDRWDKQIYALEDQVKALGSRPTQDQLDVLAKQVTDLSTQLTDANKAGAEAVAAAKKAQEDLAAAKAQEAKDTETGNAFIRFIGRLFGSNK